jgi:hypothetical protein
LEGKKIYEIDFLELTDDVLVLRLRDHQALVLPEEEQATGDRLASTSPELGGHRDH